MSDYESTFEVERIRNLITNYGWEITKQKIQEDEITLTIVKEVSPTPSAIDVGAS
jgi:hypothetical protein